MEVLTFLVCHATIIRAGRNERNGNGNYTIDPSLHSGTAWQPSVKALDITAMGCRDDFDPYISCPSLVF